MLQDTFLYVWQKAEKFDKNRGDSITWMMIVCRNRCIAKLRAKDKTLKRSAILDEQTIEGEEVWSVGGILER